MIRLMLFITALVSACAPSPGTNELPFFNSSALTPEWSGLGDHRVAAFTLTDQRGSRFDSDALTAKIYVASFIYTSCAGICPPMVSNLLKVQEAVRDDAGVALVSFSVTPETDTPASLSHFGEMRGVLPDKWHLLTGERETIYRLARESYFAERGDDVSSSSFLHTENFLLVDGLGRIRGVYNGTRAFDVEKLIEDIHVLRQSG
jgi:protein SCO1/2